MREATKTMFLAFLLFAMTGLSARGQEQAASPSDAQAQPQAGAEAKPRQIKKKQPQKLKQQAKPKAPPCCGGESPKKAALDGEYALTHICPMYPAMFHGTYTTYYALKHYYPEGPYCAEPHAYDAENNRPPANCSVHPPIDCVQQSYEDLERQGFLVLGPKAASGVRPPTKHTVNDGVSIVGTGYSIVQFKKTDASGKQSELLACVYMLDVHPAEFDPDQVAPGVDLASLPRARFGIGYQIRGGRPEREGADVVTQAEGDKWARIFVRRKGTQFDEYVVLLLE